MKNKKNLYGRNKLSASQEREHKQHEAAVSLKTEPSFIKACENAGIPATIRQCRKWLNKKGAAYKLAHKINMTGFVPANA